MRYRKSEQTSRKKQPVRAAAVVVGDIVYGDGRRMPRDESKCTHDRASVNERKREHGCSVDAARMPRHESICTHDRANGMSDNANTLSASTHPLVAG